MTDEPRRATFTPTGEPGRWLMDGYVVLERPDHPLANARGTVLEHRMVMYDAVGDLLKGYDVHHRNGDRADNRLENLVLVERREHLRRHGDDRRSVGLRDLTSDS